MTRSNAPARQHAIEEPPAERGFTPSQLRRVLTSKITLRWRKSVPPSSPLDELAQARLGRVLCGKYRLEAVLGVGGMATVYAATHRNRRRFAVKVLHPELSLNAQARARFQREGYVTNSVNHRGAVAVIDDDVAEDGSAFLVLELLEGKSVDELCQKRERALPPRTALAIADQLLDVLAAAHASGVIHRDLKPANLFVTHEGMLKVLDFGVARLHDASGSGATRTGMTLGTPAYMAPEQVFCKASEIDAQADLWAVGATLFALLSRELVFEGDDPQQLAARLTASSVRSLATTAAKVPPALVRVIDRALAFDKKERWPSATAMREALRQAHQELFGAPLTVDSAQRSLREQLAERSGARLLRAGTRGASARWRAPALWIALALGLAALLASALLAPDAAPAASTPASPRSKE
jgi:eukaryotic-like serine/threonine-protein kinase